MTTNENVIRVVRGDLLEQPVEAIVNAANCSLEGGGGVDGMIHRAAGRELVEACRLYKKEHGISQIEVGEAVLTESFDLHKQNPNILYVVHVVGPTAQNSNKEALLREAYQNALACARKQGIQTIAFPAISTGIYRYPFREAQLVAMQAIDDYLVSNPGIFSEIRLTYYSESDFNLAKTLWNEHFTR